MIDIRQEIVNNASASLAKSKDDILRKALDSLLGEWTHEDVMKHGQRITYTYEPNEYWYFKGCLIAVFTPVEFEDDKMTFKYWSCAE